jgi:uncharacterized protein (TIGR00299 family) protein
MRVLHFDCFSGAAGDMILGALLDVDADESYVRSQLDALRLEGWDLEVRDVTRSGLRAKHALVVVAEDEKARDYSAIQSILNEAALEDEVRRIARSIFEKLAAAEARVHGASIENVHLHEVGAVDAFIDIVGTAAALVSIAPDRITASPLPVGGGTTSSAHGPLPVPPPAVAESLRGIPIRGGGERELVTPTGAAILASVVGEFRDLPTMTLERTGYGAGTAERDLPNVVRVFVGESTEARGRTALLIESNLDDMSPELIPHAIERLLAAGAYDAWVTPIVMKKGRPAVTLSALVPQAELDRVLDVIYSETTTLGVRISRVEKDELERRWIEIEIEGRVVRVKLGVRSGLVVTASPEYEDALSVARETGLPLKEVYRLVTARAEERTRG